MTLNVVRWICLVYEHDLSQGKATFTVFLLGFLILNIFKTLAKPRTKMPCEKRLCCFSLTLVTTF